MSTQQGGQLQRQFPERMLSKKDLAALLAVSVRTVERLVHDGVLNPVRIRGAVRFVESEVRKICGERKFV